MCHIFIISSFVEVHVDWFHFLAFVTRVTVNNDVQVSLWYSIEYFEDVPIRGGKAMSDVVVLFPVFEKPIY